MRQKYRDFPSTIKVILIVYVIGFGVGTITHTIDIIKGGLLPYANAPVWKNIFWTSLTILDFLAIILILKSIIPGLILANSIMISDVLINTNLLSYITNYKTILQIIFGLIVLITTPFIINHLINMTKPLHTTSRHKTPACRQAGSGAGGRSRNKVL